MRQNPYERPESLAKQPRRAGSRILVKGCLGILALTGAFIAACPFALRSYLPRNRARVVNNIRLVMQAEEQFAEANGGYTWVGCLALPEECWTSYPKDGPRFLSERPTWGFWRMTFIPGPPVEAGVDHTFKSYALVARIPLDGQSSFCADSAGTFCLVKYDLGWGHTAQVEDGRCVVTDPARHEVELDDLDYSYCVPME